jgi:sulfatase maturation enzyme AslB (radical SAM superfamily)
VGEQAYVFDPESADITLISAQVEAVLKALQAGEQLPEDLLSGIVELLNLEPVSNPEAETSYDRWGITIHLNHACNLACEYCYADGRTSDFEGNAKGAYGGSTAVISKIVLDAGLEKFMRDAPTDNVLISFLGGEPLLSEERFLEAVRIIAEKAAKYGRRPTFQLTTNGTRNTPAILQCLKEHSFSVVVSMDGNREMHNRQRPKAGGSNSYDQVLRGAQQLSESGIKLGLRMTAIRGRPGVEKAHRSLASGPAEAVGFQFHLYGGDALRPLQGEERETLFAHYLDIAHRILSGRMHPSS